MTIITIDGNIGAGKTSVLTYLHKVHKYSIDLEPVESWTKYLDDMYNRKADVFNFQVRVWLDRCWIQEKTERNIILMERSPYFIRNTFIGAAYENKLIDEKEFGMLMELHKKTDTLWKDHKHIYLRADPSNCFYRINKRGRQTEANITQQYINELHLYHERCFEMAKEVGMDIVVIDIDNKNINDIAKEIMAYI